MSDLKPQEEAPASILASGNLDISNPAEDVVAKKLPPEKHTEISNKESEEQDFPSNINIENAVTTGSDGLLNILEISETEEQTAHVHIENMETTLSEDAPVVDDSSSKPGQDEIMEIDKPLKNRTEEKSNKSNAEENASKVFKKTGDFYASDVLNLIMDSSQVDETVSDFDDSSMSTSSFDKTLQENEKSVQLMNKSEDDSFLEQNNEKTNNITNSCDNNIEKDDAAMNENVSVEAVKSNEDKSTDSKFDEPSTDTNDFTGQNTAPVVESKQENENLGNKNEETISKQNLIINEVIDSEKQLDQDAKGQPKPNEILSDSGENVVAKDKKNISSTEPTDKSFEKEDDNADTVETVEEKIQHDKESDESEESDLIIQEEKEEEEVSIPAVDEVDNSGKLKEPDNVSPETVVLADASTAKRTTSISNTDKMESIDSKVDIKMEMKPIVHIEEMEIKKEKISQYQGEITRKRPRTKSISPKGGKSMERQSGKGLSPGWKPKKKRPPPKDDGQDGRNDFYCWVCHREGEVLCCELCPRVFHAKCLRMAKEPEGDWFCPECEKITNAECAETRSRAMAQLTPDQLAVHLRYVVQRLKIQGSEPFHEPVDTNSFKDYRDYIFHPMDLSTIEKRVKNKDYGSTEAFLADLKWIVHNCIIYNSINSMLTQTAKRICKTADRELSEIEVCPECYLKSCRRRDNWFCDPCKEQHPLVWAKLQGFPHWPAKALRIDKSMVDVRFFGQHDRAWIPLSGCYLLSKDLPAAVKSKKKGRGPNLRGGLDNAMAEMQVYIENVIKVTGKFDYAPPRSALTHCDLHRSSEGSSYEVASGNDVPLKKMKMVTTGGEHPARGFTKKKRASMQFLDKTIESCKTSLGIDNLKDITQSSEDESSSEDDQIQSLENKLKLKQMQEEGKNEEKPAEKLSDDDDSDAELVIDLNDEPPESNTTEKSNNKEVKQTDSKPVQDDESGQMPAKAIKSILNSELQSERRKKEIAKALSEKIAQSSKSKTSNKRKIDPDPTTSSPVNKASKSFLDDLRPEKKKSFGSKITSESPHKKENNFDKISFNRKSSKHKLLLKQKTDVETSSSSNQSNLKETARTLAQKIAARKQIAEKQQQSSVRDAKTVHPASHAITNGTGTSNNDRLRRGGLEEFKKYSSKVMDTLESVFFDIYTTMIEPTNTNSDWPNSSQPASQVRLELERLKWMHQQEIAEIKHNHALVEAEIRQSLDNEKNQVLRDMKLKYEKERAKVVEETKKKQWCANCSNEAMFYCCWNTSYCDYPCQQRHWPQHMAQCTQALSNDSKNDGGLSKNNLVTAKSTTVKESPQIYTQSSLVIPTSLPITKLSQSSATSFPPKGILISSHKPFTTVKAVKDVPVKVVTSRGSITAIGAKLLAKQTTDKSAMGVDTKTIHKPIPVFSKHVKTTSESPASPDHEKVAMDSPLSPDLLSTKSKLVKLDQDSAKNPAVSVAKETTNTLDVFSPASPDNESDRGLIKDLLKSKPAVGVVPLIEPVLAKGYLSTLHKTLSTTSTFKPISSTELADMAKPTTTA